MANLDQTLQLFLARADEDRQPTLAQGLPSSASQLAPRPAPLTAPRNLRDFSAHGDDLTRQRWGVVAPPGELGDRLLAAIEPLIQRRSAQQNAPVVKLRTPTAGPMAIADAVIWRDNELFTLNKPAIERRREIDIPRYLLLLGDLHQLPDTIRQVLQIEGFVGRLAFTKANGEADLDRYAAYAQKVLRWEDKPSSTQRAPSQFFVVRDGSMATEAGLQSMVQPALQIAEQDRKFGDFPACQFQQGGDVGILKRSNLLSFAQQAESGVLFSVSHGLGAPTDGWSSLDLQHQQQGAMKFGRGPDGLLSAADVPSAPFLPGGVWFMFACFGAGTPSESVFQHWLATLQENGQFGGNLAKVLTSLPKSNEPPFIAALPQTVLANPDGPLAFIGHLDLAWSYGFQDMHTGSAREQPQRFLNVVRSLLDRHRVGLALYELLRNLGSAESDLAVLYDTAARDKTQVAPVRLGHLFMVRQDLLGYTLLGDPAVRLPLAPEQTQRAAAVDPRMLLGLPMQQSTAVSASAILGMQVSADPTPAATQSAAAAPSTEAIEHAIGHVLAGSKQPQDAARDEGIDASELSRLLSLYRAAGRSAIGRAR